MTRPFLPGDRVRITTAADTLDTLDGETGVVAGFDPTDILPYAVLIDFSGEGALPTYFDADELTLIEAVTNATYTEDAGQ